MNGVAEGSIDTIIDDVRQQAILERFVTGLGPVRRALLIPPDITRIHSNAGPIASQLYRLLSPAAHVDVLPAIGTHSPMTDTEIGEMFPGVPRERFHVHDWRRDLILLGEVPSSFVKDVSGGRIDYSIPIHVNRRLLDGDYDAILSIGQLAPHEVVGIANHAKNIFIGVGGKETIDKSHFLGAAYGMERMMGRAATPVRAVLQWASRHLAAALPIHYLLTVRGRHDGRRLVTRGLFIGSDDHCFQAGAELAREVNLDFLDRSPRKVVVSLDAQEYRSTWLGNKAIYRTRMAIADEGELVVLAPGVKEFGEDPTIDRLIRRFGYRGTPQTLAAVQEYPELANNLSAAAHLIHGSTEGRFRVTYCPGVLSREEIEGVGFGYAELGPMLSRYDPNRLRDGWNRMPDGEEIFFISNPGLGLWGTRERFGAG